ncbi:hypothetical protein QEL91_004942 [Pseudomonas putida]|nr:hypothetical protein [Pseudomonas putida]
MGKKFLIIAVSTAIAIITIIATVYISTFGLSRSHDQAVWGTFGDYFGGILNPVFALFAFLGVLWSLDLQMKQVKQLSEDKRADEILQVVKDIDARLHELLKTQVAISSSREVLISHMAAESWRVHEQSSIDPNFLAAEDIYIEFLTAAESSGSLIGMAVREMANQVSTMADFLKRYPLQQGGEYNPIIEYYRTKTSRLIPMLKDTERLSESSQAFFETPE